MPISNADIAALPTYTSVEQLKMWQKASIDLAANGSAYTISGRSLTKANGAEVQNMIQYWAEIVAAEQAGAGGYGNVLVTLGGDH
jgi:hypothetical protein